MPKANSSEPKPLTFQAKLFIHEYLIDQNATQAAIRAGYSETSAHTYGHSLLQDPRVKDLVELGMARLFKEAGVKGTEVLKRLDNIADVDIADAYDENSCFLPIHEIPKEVRKCISSVKVFERWIYEDHPEHGRQVKVKEGEVIEIKWCDRVKSNELLGRNQKLFTDKLEVEGDLTIADSMRKARERSKER